MDKKYALHRWFFYLLLILLPTNLGKHFISVNDYVGSRLVDYLIPTIWLQDILIFLTLLLYLFESGSAKVKKFKHLKLVGILLLAFLPSVFAANNFSSAIYFYATFVLHILLLVYVAVEGVNLEKIKTIFFWQLIFLVFIAAIQWFKQSSVFNNYLFFGEQSYNKSTFNIARENFFGKSVIPSYSLFRHPNVFCGYLSIFVVWFVFWLFENSKNKIKNKIALVVAFAGILLSFSGVAFFVAIFGILFFLGIRYFGKKGVLFSLVLTSLVIAFGMLFHKVPNLMTELNSNPSIFRRTNLIKSANSMISKNFYWGVGINNFTVALKNYLPKSQFLVFNQPVHNIFLLIWSESGVFAFCLYILLIFKALQNLLNSEYGFGVVLFINILQFLILGSFDHYVYTINPTPILFLLTLGLSLTYTNNNAKV